MSDRDTKRGVSWQPILLALLFCFCAAVLSWFLGDMDQFLKSKWLWLSFLVFSGLFVYFRCFFLRVYKTATAGKNATLAVLLILSIASVAGIACKFWLPARF